MYHSFCMKIEFEKVFRSIYGKTARQLASLNIRSVYRLKIFIIEPVLISTYALRQGFQIYSKLLYATHIYNIYILFSGCKVTIFF